MHLPGTKNTLPEISEPHNARPMEDQSQAKMFNEGGNTTVAETTGMAPGVAPTHTHGFTHPQPDQRHVFQPGANQPTGAMNMHDPTRGDEAGVFPPPQSGSTMPGDQGFQGVEGKLPFKEQVRAYTKIHRGTLTGNHEEKELGQKILAGEVPPQ